MQILKNKFNRMSVLQLKLDKTTYHTFGENYESGELRNWFKNVTIRKRKLLPLTSEDRLKNTPSIYLKFQ